MMENSGRISELYSIPKSELRNQACKELSKNTKEKAGIGTHMMQKVKEELIKLGCTDISLHCYRSNEKAKQFYEKFGFQLLTPEEEKEITEKTGLKTNALLTIAERTPSFREKYKFTPSSSHPSPKRSNIHEKPEDLLER